MARTSLLLALALMPAAYALGVVKPDCTCAAGEEAVILTGGNIEIIDVPEKLCGEPFNTCVGIFTCDITGWDFNETGGSCAGESTKSGCEGLGGTYLPPVGDECCGTCELK